MKLRRWMICSDGYFRMMRDYIVNGKLQGRYGRAKVDLPQA